MSDIEYFEGKNLFPLSDLIGTDVLPETLIEFGEAASDFLEKIYFTDAIIERVENGLNCRILFALLQEISFSLLGIDSIGFVIGGRDGLTFFEAEATFTIDASGFSFNIRLSDILISLRVDANIIRPIDPETHEPDLEAESLDIPLGNIIIEFNSDGGIDFEFDTEISLPPFMIGNTGVIIEADKFIPVLSENQPDAIPDSIPAEWRGIFLDDVKIVLPPDISIALPSDVQLDDFFIGSGGFSGKITGNWSPQLSTNGKSFTGNGAGSICGIPLGLKSISLEFKQNTFVESSLIGTMILPFFDGPIDVEICLANDGDFAVNILSSTGDALVKLTKEELLELSVQNIGFAYQDSIFSVTLGGKIKPLFGGMDWPEVEIKALTIDSEGNVKVDGGWIEIPKQLSMDFHGFKLELTKIGFGKEEDGSKWIGMSGGINIVEGIPLKGGVDGLKLIWRPDDTFGLEISGINVAFEIEDVLSFDGKVFFIDEPTKKGFKGGVKMIIYPLDGMMIDAQFIAGKNTQIPAFNFFYIFIGAELPVGIPLGSTGAALYGMAGLFGYNMLVDKREDEAWFENDDGSDGFYKRARVGITSIEKWTDFRDALAFGAGITLGTAWDNGFTFSGKVLLVIMIPGPVILIEGKAAFLQERSKLEEPIFRVLAVLDCNAATFLMNIEAHYKYPDDGCVVDVGGVLEIFFNFNNPKAWHFYLGQKTPESKRIRAKILSLFQANYYLMIDSNMFEMGSWMGYKNSWKFGPLSVKLEAWMEAILGMSYEPVQAWGSLTLCGDIQLKVFGIGFGLSVFAMLAATTPNPWWVKGELKVKLNLPWPLPDPEADITLEWKEDRLPPTPSPIGSFGIEHLKVSEKWDLNPNDSKQDSPVVPLDAKPIVNFAKPVEDGPLVGNNPAPAPSAEKVDKYYFKYRLKKVILEKQSKGSVATWIKVAEKSEDSSDGDSVLYGEWQVIPGESLNSKLILWANTPFDISRELESNHAWLFSMMEDKLGYPCAIDTTPECICIDFEKLIARTIYFPLLSMETRYLFFSEHVPMQIKYYPGWPGVKNVLSFEPSEYKKDKKDKGSKGDRPLSTQKAPFMFIVFPTEMAKIELFFTKGSRGKITILEKMTHKIGETEFDFSERTDSDMEPVILEVEENNIKALIVSGEFKLGRICMITKEEHIRVENNQNILTHKMRAVEERWGEHVGAMLEPNHYYKLKIYTETLRKKEGGSWIPHEFSEEVYFQTENPPGAYTPLETNNEMELTSDSEHYPERGPLKDLSPYISQTIPSMAASNEPQILVYRSYDIGVIFNEEQGYVEQMYHMAGLPLTVRVFDNNSQPVLNTNGEPLIFDNEWGDNPEIFLTREEQQWKTLLENNCIRGTELISDYHTTNLFCKSKGLSLKPQTFYKAKLFAGDDYSVYEFGFVTSRYCTFLHHIHSFIDAVWDYYKLSGHDPLLDANGLNELKNTLFSITEQVHHKPEHYAPENESDKFEKLMNIFQLGVRPFPEQLEILLLNDNQKSYGLLLESPEPIDWSRLETQIKYTSVSEMIEESTSLVKIVRANIDNVGGGNYNEEWIDLLLLEQTDVSGMVIKHKKIGDSDFSNYYQFGEEKIFPPGTVLRIHSGNKENNPNHSEEIEHFYLNPPDGEGVWKFDSQGETIQIIDDNGIILQTRSFVNYTIRKKFIIIRSQDQTRAFIFFPNELEKYSDLVDGRYRFEFIFKRRIDDKPILKRMRSESDEKAIIEFSLPTFLP